MIKQHTRIANPSYSGRHRGFTLVEFLIAGVLGLVLLAGIGQLFIGSNQSFRMQRDLAEVQDSGRFALWHLKRDLELAGWNEVAGSQTQPLPTAILFAPDADTPVNFCGAEDECSSDGGDDESDSVTTTYIGTVDCSGSEVNSGDLGVVQNRYFLQDGQLYCHGIAGVSQPLIANVDAFQILYGIDLKTPPTADIAAKCPDRAVDQYVLAGAIPGDAVIVAVRFSILIGGNENNNFIKQERTYQVNDRSYTFDDKTPRRVFNLTVPVRNPALLAEPCPKTA